MRMTKIGSIICGALMLLPFSLWAGDFAWMKDFDMRAQADLTGFRASLGTRFNVGDAQIGLVLSNVDRPADAYMVFRLGEMSRRPPHYVMERYRSGRGRGWGNLAKSLGIKPGSREFHELKAGRNLWADNHSGRGKNKDKGSQGKDRGQDDDGRSKGHGKGQGKGHGKG
ncbi:MAG TPA: hypothetical protein DCR97_10860 [Deltaproteobacteria bacterium]|nr:hypothetical protein [Deltaproteobacteria bacterium]